MAEETNLFSRRYSSRSLLVTLIIILVAQFNVTNGHIDSEAWATAIMFACIMYGGKRMAESISAAKQ